MFSKTLLKIGENKPSAVKATTTLRPSCKVIQGSLGLRKSRCGFRIPGTGFRILVTGTWIRDFNNLRDSGFLEADFRSRSPEYWNSKAKISRIPESALPYIGVCQEFQKTKFKKFGSSEDSTHNQTIWKFQLF